MTVRPTLDGAKMSREEKAWQMAYEYADDMVKILFHPDDPRHISHAERDKLARAEYRKLMYP